MSDKESLISKSDSSKSSNESLKTKQSCRCTIM